MIKTYYNILSKTHIDFILNLPEVKKSKENIDKKIEGSIYFSITLSHEIQKTLFDKLGLNLTNVPMRWIKGDTKSHIDHGEDIFNNTYLVYITDSKGDLLIDHQSYPIEQNTAYVFSEGLKHETINTGYIPRLLLGPMSETGFAVGTGISRPGGTTIYFRQTSDVQYSVNNQISWVNLGNNYPMSISNTDTSAGVLTIEFLTNITFDNTFGGNFKYFICATEYIQFGSTSLKNDGTRPIIIIDGVTNYPGLIQNGSNSLNGFNNIYIYNLEITTANSSELISNGGWFGQEYFAKGVVNCYILNCHSDGPIIDAGGGIVGGYAASSNGILNIKGCSSSGNLSTYSGGIVGYFAGKNSGTITCTSCWSTGSIGVDSGGIFGYSAGDTLGEIIAINCYSTGIIGINGGGIFGRLGGTSGYATAQKCYSQGDISADAGGIFGRAASSDGGTTSAVNCYSLGNISTPGNGIYGSNPQPGFTQTNCYFANGTWNTATANTQLIGIPTDSKVGTIWVSTITNQPYELLNMGYTPYTISNILGETSLETIFTQTINAGENSSNAIISGKSYSILAISVGGIFNSYPGITINSTSGIVSTTTNLNSGLYTIYIRNTGSYNITKLNLNLNVNIINSVIRTNSFTMYDLGLEELTNSIYLEQGGTLGSSYNNSFTIYNIELLELLNNSSINN